ncbi:MAG: hypothetical protein NTV21_12605 [Planctomycetota bacterium]|nr:hypothetical protein [Planctomycetota bacterium]
MRTLRSIVFYLHNDDFRGDAPSDFMFRSCYVGHYLSRRLRSVGRASGVASCLFVQGRSTSAEPTLKNGQLIVPVEHDVARFKALDDNGRHELYLDMLARALRSCEGRFELPLATIEAEVSAFRQGGYREEWIQKRRGFRTLGISASLACTLNAREFSCRLLVEKRRALVLDQELLIAKPDELIFAHHARDLQLVGDSLVVVDWRGRPKYELPLERLSQAGVSASKITDRRCSHVGIEGCNGWIY